MIPANKSIQYQPDSITCIAQAVLVIPQDSVLLNTLPQQQPSKHWRAAVWFNASLAELPALIAQPPLGRSEMRSRIRPFQDRFFPLFLPLVSAYRFALSKHPFCIPPVQPNQILWDPRRIYLSFHSVRGNGEEELRDEAAYSCCTA